MMEWWYSGKATLSQVGFLPTLLSIAKLMIGIRLQQEAFAISLFKHTSDACHQRQMHLVEERQIRNFKLKEEEGT